MNQKPRYVGCSVDQATYVITASKAVVRVWRQDPATGLPCEAHVRAGDQKIYSGYWETIVFKPVYLEGEGPSGVISRPRTSVRPLVAVAE